jgi:asparagine synthase (glutamine-hydrolysing)
MCGICGIVDFNGQHVEFERLAVMRDTLLHRGPDDSGIVIFNDSRTSVGLAHRRLSIIDLSTAAHQPMANEDESVWLVYNGEVYNYAGLANRLKSLGHKFCSTSDTEVILHAYEEWGISFLEKLNGMFALAIWDAKQGHLFLARDRLGIKPLHYIWDGKLFAFCSEIAGLLPLVKSGIDINRSALAFYLTLGYTVAPHTIYSGVQRLEPGHYLLLKPGQLMNRKYWDVDLSLKQERPLAELINETATKFRESVISQLISDVPLGIFLSGGVDSSAVVAMASQSLEGQAKTFSIGFREKDFDETRYASIVARLYNTDHHTFQVEPDAVSVLPTIVRHFGEPFADSAALPTYYLSEMTRRHVKVALSGDGGDELFCGYTIYLGHKLSELYCLLPNSVRAPISHFLKRIRWSGNPWADRVLVILQKRLEDAEMSAVDRVFSKNCVFPEDLRRQLFPGFEVSAAPVIELFDQLLSSGNADSFLDRIAYLQLKLSLPDDMLTKVDRMSMAHSLEVRVPFLDHEFVEYVATVPAETRFRFWRTKWLLRKAMEPYLPKAIIWRGKHGFNVPLQYWFKKSSSYENITRGHPSDGNTLWGELVLTEWRRQFNNHVSTGGLG